MRLAVVFSDEKRILISVRRSTLPCEQTVVAWRDASEGELAGGVGTGSGEKSSIRKASLFRHKGDNRSGDRSGCAVQDHSVYDSGAAADHNLQRIGRSAFD